MANGEPNEGIPCDGCNMIIYKIENKITNNVYIGQTNNVDETHFNQNYNYPLRQPCND